MSDDVLEEMIQALVPFAIGAAATAIVAAETGLSTLEAGTALAILPIAIGVAADALVGDR